MKIGIVTNLYPPYVRGGAEIVAVRTVEELMSRGHDVFVITAGPKNKYPDGPRLSPTAIERVYRFFPRNVYFVLDDYKHSWPVRLIWHIWDAFCFHGKEITEDILEHEKPDVVITHNLKGMGLRIPQGIQKMGIPHIHLMHDLQLIYPSGLLFAGEERIPWHTKPFYWVYRQVCKWALGQPDHVIFPSRFLRREYEKHGFFKKTTRTIMPNPAPNFTAIERGKRLKPALQLLFVGQLESHKGIHFLIDMVKKLDGRVHLIIAGEGRDKDRIEAESTDSPHITYLGYIALDQLIDCFSFADALVVPSLCYENSPTVIYESLQAGVPVIASDIGGVGELVKHGENGFLFTPESEEAFIAAIDALDASKDEFIHRQRDIAETVRKYALPKYVNKLETLLGLLLKNVKKGEE